MSKDTRDGIDFFPLSVEFEEKLYAAGKIKGSRFIKREGRPTDEAILTGRLVDRSIRPLFDESMRNDIQIILTALSVDGENDTQITALLAASIVLSISNIPWDGPIAGARVARLDNKWLLNPTCLQKNSSDTDVVVVGTPEKIIMVEAGCKEVPEEEIISAMKFGALELQTVLDFINKITKEVGQTKIDLNAEKDAKEIELEKVEKEVREFVTEKSEEWIFNSVKPGRKERVELLDKFTAVVKEMLTVKETDETIKKSF